MILFPYTALEIFLPLIMSSGRISEIKEGQGFLYHTYMVTKTRLPHLRFFRFMFVHDR